MGLDAAAGALILLGGSAPQIAPRLLGWGLEHRSAQGRVVVRITEVEAYAGGADPASHAYRGLTERTAVMFGRAGGLYVYRSYGLHWACNIVCGPEGVASAVLVRAGAVVVGEDLANRRRGHVSAAALARGPGNLTRALGITAVHNGVDLLDPGSPVRLIPASDDVMAADPPSVMTGPRVGVSRAWARPWRFWIAGDPSVSTYRRSPRATSESEHE